MTDKNPWQEYPEIWKNSTAWFTYLRGCLRKAWNTNPIKVQLLKKHRRQIPNPNPNGKKDTVWGTGCSLCGREYPMKEIQVDHIHPAGSLNGKEDIEPFVVRLLFVTEADLRLVCKTCHGVQTYAEKQGISFEQALAEKQAIAISKRPVAEVRAWLEERNTTPASTAAARRQQIVEVLLAEMEDN